MDEQETWQALMDLIETMNAQINALLCVTSATNAVVRAMLLELPHGQKPALAAKIRELAQLRDDLSLPRQITDQQRNEYLQEVERFAQLLGS